MKKGECNVLIDKINRILVMLQQDGMIDLEFAGFDASVTWNDRKTVQTAWIGVAQLLKETRLSSLKEQKLSIKVEINTRPPAGAKLMTKLMTRYVMFAIQHHDLSSLMAGKIRALITRAYPKGRDWYDFAWYRAQRPAVTPNITLLQNALDQNQDANTQNAQRWKAMLRKILKTIDAKQLQKDVGPFLENPQDKILLTQQYLQSLLRR